MSSFLMVWDEHRCSMGEKTGYAQKRCADVGCCAEREEEMCDEALSHHPFGFVGLAARRLFELRNPME